MEAKSNSFRGLANRLGPRGMVSRRTQEVASPSLLLGQETQVPHEPLTLTITLSGADPPPEKERERESLLLIGRANRRRGDKSLLYLCCLRV